MNLTEQQRQELTAHLAMCQRLYAEISIPTILDAENYAAAHSAIAQCRGKIAILDSAIFQLFHILHTFNQTSYYTFLTPGERDRKQPKPTIDDL